MTKGSAVQNSEYRKVHESPGQVSEGTKKGGKK
jgi:hypothetical protein